MWLMGQGGHQLAADKLSGNAPYWPLISHDYRLLHALHPRRETADRFYYYYKQCLTSCQKERHRLGSPTYTPIGCRAIAARDVAVLGRRYLWHTRTLYLNCLPSEHDTREPTEQDSILFIKKDSKTYNSRYSLVVTDLTINQPLSSVHPVWESGQDVLLAVNPRACKGSQGPSRAPRRTG